jgi:hypothetical protein
MRLRAALAACLLLGAAPALGATPPLGGAHPAECARLKRQIDHFEGMVERAEEAGNELWSTRTQQHVDLLRKRQSERCPDDAQDNAAKEAFIAFMNLLKVAGQAALTYFTFGAM